MAIKDYKRLITANSQIHSKAVILGRLSHGHVYEVTDDNSLRPTGVPGAQAP